MILVLPAVQFQNHQVIPIRSQSKARFSQKVHHPDFQPINLYTDFYQPCLITMPREFRYLVMTNIRRIARSPKDAECMARFLLMQVILVCVAEAAQKTWFAQRPVPVDPGTDGIPDGSSTPSPASAGSEGPDFSERCGTPRRALWDFFCGPGNISPAVPVGAPSVHLHR